MIALKYINIKDVSTWKLRVANPRVQQLDLTSGTEEIRIASDDTEGCDTREISFPEHIESLFLACSIEMQIVHAYMTSIWERREGLEG